jgi:hypothetical protein
VGEALCQCNSDPESMVIVSENRLVKLGAWFALMVLMFQFMS